MHKVLLLLATILVILIPLTSSATIHQVDMVGLTFVPDSLTITEGDTVLWINQSAISHTSTSGTGGVHDSIWDSGFIAAGDSFSLSFDTLVGTFPYFCIPHWNLGMVGVIFSQSVGIEDDNSDKKGNILIYRNFPNPFLTQTKIKYEVSKPGEVDIEIYSITGRLIRTITKRYTHPGTHYAQWDGKNSEGFTMTGGVYFIRFTFENTVFIQKITKLPL